MTDDLANDVHEEDDQPPGLADRLDDVLRRFGMHTVLVLATIATTGSLFFSEVKHYLPCPLCWYQRGLMYPMIAVATAAILMRNVRLALVTLAMSVGGMAIASYHYALEKTQWFDALDTCKGGVPCTTPWINAFGFITIPFLSLTAFTLIALVSSSAWRNRDEVAEALDDGSANALTTVGVLVVVGLVLGLLVGYVFSHPALQPRYT